jgi:hypothetical protein
MGQAAQAADHQSSSNWAWAGKFQAKSSGWDENRTFLEGDVLEVAVRNGRPDRARPPRRLQHYFPTEE